MNVLGHGIDVIQCGRIAEMVERHGQRFLTRVFTPVEIEYCWRRKRRIESLAGRFAAKEAILKALGCGWRGGIAWTDMEIDNDPAGRPRVRLTGHTKRRAEALGVIEVLVSISHTADLAAASAIATGR